MHPNTLAYRLRRFGTLARRDLASTGAPGRGLAGDPCGGRAGPHRLTGFPVFPA
ncbi:hypothetical protein [Streptomyces mutomycini]|uniref:hypothetical protein n=1 Tax=Streptomyces mutomycini TaxID=284036 RepID=UPI00340A8555